MMAAKGNRLVAAAFAVMLAVFATFGPAAYADEPEDASGAADAAAAANGADAAGEPDAQADGAGDAAAEPDAQAADGGNAAGEGEPAADGEAQESDDASEGAAPPSPEDGEASGGRQTVEVDPALQDDNQVNPQQLPDSSFIYDISIADLSTADAYYDGQTVQVVGEAIGDNIRASFNGKQRWVTLSSVDSSATIAVIMSADAAARIDTFGAYNVRGSIVQVRGIYHLVCAEHEGVSDLHAEVVNIVEKGQVSEDPFDWKMFLPGAVFVVAGLFMMGLFYFLRERRR